MGTHHRTAAAVASARRTAQSARSRSRKLSETERDLRKNQRLSMQNGGVDAAGFHLLAISASLVGLVFVLTGFNIYIIGAYLLGVLVTHISQDEVTLVLAEIYDSLLSASLFRMVLPNPKKIRARIRGQLVAGDPFQSLLFRFEYKLYSILEGGVKEKFFQDAEDASKKDIFRIIMNFQEEEHFLEEPDIIQLMDEKFEERNSAGATPFLFAVLVEKSRLVDLFATQFGDDVIAQQYTKGIYEGENALHIAIAQKNYALAKKLIVLAKKHDLVHDLLGARAKGSFFSPLNKDAIHNEASMISMCSEVTVHYGRSLNHLYFGEYPLSFAVSTNQCNMFNLLLRHADPLAQDSRGNTILHLAVIHNLPNMIIHISDRMKKRMEFDQLWGMRNKDDATAIALAAELGNTTALETLIDVKRVLYWKYASITAYTFPLQDLLEKGGVVERVIRNKHTDLVKVPLVASILVKQWNAGFDRLFRVKLYSWALYLVLLSIAALRGIDISGFVYVPGYFTNYLPSIIVLYLAGQKLRVELLEFLHSRMDYFRGSPTEVIENVCSLSSCLTALLAVAFSSRFFFSLALFSGWLYVLFFLLGFRSTGTFVAIIIKLLVDDVLVFSSVMSVIVLAFANFFFHAVEASTFEEFMHHLDLSFQTILGDYDISNFRESPKHSALVSFVSVVYALFISITLINSLIAKMSTEYEYISEHQGLYWILERGRIMHSIASEYGGYQSLVREWYNRKKVDTIPPLQKFWVHVGENAKDFDLGNLAFEFHEEDKSYYTDTRTGDDTGSE